LFYLYRMKYSHGILGLFALLFITLVVNPRIIFKMQNNILGRLVLIGVVLLSTTSNVTLGLLSALCLIIVSNMFFMEGMDNINLNDSGKTIGDDTVEEAGVKQQVLAKKAANAANTAEVTGVDRETIKQSIQSVSSKTLPIDSSAFNSSDTEVEPSEPTTTESFSSRIKPIF
jgi:K+-sensing histidine kinase KdpD